MECANTLSDQMFPFETKTIFFASAGIYCCHCFGGVRLVFKSASGRTRLLYRCTAFTVCCSGLYSDLCRNCCSVLNVVCGREWVYFILFAEDADM